MKKKLSNYIVIDCETGGLDKKNNEHAINHSITQIACLGIYQDTLQEIGRYETYISGIECKILNNNTQEDIINNYKGYGDKHVYQIQALLSTNINIDILKEKGKHIKQVVKELSEIFTNFHYGNNYSKPIIVGHNVTYDIPFISYAFELCKVDLSKFLSGYWYKGTFQPNYFDTMWLSRAKSIDENLKHNLTDTCKRYNVELIDAHSAMNDVIATKELFVNFLLMLRNNSINIGSQQVERFRENFKFEF